MKTSLYIPCFNAEAYIDDVLKGVFKQSLLPDEVIVVDDNSTDRTVEIVSRYPVKLIRHRRNKGLACTRNTAIKNIDSEIIASLDADCIPEANWLKQLLKRFTSSRLAGVGGRLLDKHASTIFDQWRSVHMKQYWEKKTAPPFLFGSNTAFRREAIAKVGLYNEDFKNNYEDVDICNRLKEKGYILAYEPKAIAHHLKRDNIYLMLNTYWSWNLAYYQEKKYYRNPKSFSRKLKDNIGLANRYIEEDIASERYQLLYLDLLLALHHSLKDFGYFTFQENVEYLDYPFLPVWLSLINLTFFFHFDAEKDSLSTLMPKTALFLQNFFALNLVIGKTIRDKFKTKRFKRTLYRHLILSIYPAIDDKYLLDKVLNLVELRPDWNQLCKKEHPHLNTSFLRELSCYFRDWLDRLMFTYPDIVRLIEISAKDTDK
jgi:glycosyltransferase involved in cell wall biosynthesis